MADGHIPSTGFNRQLVRLVNKDQRRPQNSIETQSRWQNRQPQPGASGSGCCQVEAAVYDYLLNGTITGSGARVWKNPCGGRLPKIRCYFKGTLNSGLPGGTDYPDMNRNSGYIEWSPPATVRLVWDKTRIKYYADLEPADLTVVDGAGTNLKATETYNGFISEDPFSGYLQIYLYSTDPQAGVTDTYGSLWYYSGQQNQFYADYTKANTYWLQLASGGQWWGPEPGPLKICTEPSAETIATTGTVQWSLESAISSQTDFAEYASINFTMSMVVDNQTSENITVKYDPNDFTNNEWFTFQGAIGSASLAAAGDYTVNAGTTNTKTLINETGYLINWNEPSAIPGNPPLDLSGRQKAIGVTSLDTYESGLLTHRRYVVPGGP